MFVLRAASFDRVTVALVVGTGAGLVAGAVLHAAGSSVLGDVLWAATGVVAAVPLVVGFIDAIRNREWGLDVIAILAIGGAIVLGEFLAAAIVGVMLATGEALDTYAAARAEHDLSELLRRAPQTANRLTNGRVETVPVDEIEPGDQLIVRTGEVVPVDGAMISDRAILDESSLTGEAIPVTRCQGDHVASGVVNTDAAFEVIALAKADASTYAGIVRLVESARASKAPVARLADRYAAGFVPLALAIAAIAWAVSGDPIRALSVLVVATPCPLLLAVPIAIVSGVSRTARVGVVVKGGGALERLADAETLIIDKTGTLTVGEARVTDVVMLTDDLTADRLLHFAASVEQLSSHVLAAAVVAAARARGIGLAVPTDVQETAGAGMRGTVDGHDVRVGSADWILDHAGATGGIIAQQARRRRSPSTDIYVAVDGVVAGALRLTDEIRSDTPRTIRLLRGLGFTSIIMATGDHPVVAEAVGSAIGVDRVLSQCTPQEKVDAVRAASRDHVTVMVGDGINDAPALAAADVGVAVGARGATSSSEAADVVLVVDQLSRLVDGVKIARRSRTIAAQSAFLGMGLSLAAMIGATAGLLNPVSGALLQEAIDVVAILSALRALRSMPGGSSGARIPEALAATLREDHDHLVPRLRAIGELADTIDTLPRGELNEAIRSVDTFLQDEIVPHEQEDERHLYPELARYLEGDDPLAAMSLTHGEIFKLAGLFHSMAEATWDQPEDPVDTFELRRLLYGLDAVLHLHFAQEEALFESIDDRYHERLRDDAME